MSTATVHRPLSHQRPTVKSRVDAIRRGDHAARYWCGRCAHPLSEHDEFGCNHHDTYSGRDQLCGCRAQGSAR